MQRLPLHPLGSSMSTASSSAVSTPYLRGPGTPILGMSASGAAPSPRPSGQVSSAADLTASVRRTSTAERPPPLVGCSVTLVGDCVYVFGGRLVPTRTMVDTLYCLELATGEWSRLWPPRDGAASVEGGEAEDDDDKDAQHAPQARYFHSACAWGDKLVLFGGEGYAPDAAAPVLAAGGADGAAADPAFALCTLDDVCVWDTTQRRWLSGETKCAEGVERPAARYAHLGVVTSVQVSSEQEGGEGRERSVMLVMGGQDVRNTCESAILPLPVSPSQSRGHCSRSSTFCRLALDERARPRIDDLGKARKVGPAHRDLPSSCSRSAFQCLPDCLDCIAPSDRDRRSRLAHPAQPLRACERRAARTPHPLLQPQLLSSPPRS